MAATLGTPAWIALRAMSRLSSSRSVRETKASDWKMLSLSSTSLSVPSPWITRALGSSSERCSHFFRFFSMIRTCMSDLESSQVR